MQRLAEGNKSDQGDPFDILFQYFVFWFNGLVQYNVGIIKITSCI